MRHMLNVKINGMSKSLEYPELVGVNASGDFGYLHFTISPAEAARLRIDQTITVSLETEDEARGTD